MSEGTSAVDTMLLGTLGGKGVRRPPLQAGGKGLRLQIQMIQSF
jgi:hypothetical protein